MLNLSVNTVDEPCMTNSWGVHRLSVVVVLAYILTFIPSSNADRFMLHDGRIIEGEVIAEDDVKLTVETSIQGSTFISQRLSKSQIKTWFKPVREGPSYVTIPIIGGIGDDVTVDAVRNGLTQARASNPKYIVLAIDSLGGDFDTMRKIVDLLKDTSKDFEVVAYVKRAVSAAAVIAVTCREVYMLPDAVIGANVPWRPTENGPADVDAKFRSFIDATVRAATEHGQHSDLLVRGMSELDLEIYLAQTDGKPTLSTSGPGKLIKSKGQILSMTASEAVECGLAQTTAGMSDIGKQLCGGAWHEASRRPWNVTIGTVASQRRREREAIEQTQRAIARRNAIVDAKPQLDSIEHRIAELAARAVANQNAINDLTARCNEELQQINAEYQQTVNNLPQYVQPQQPIFDRNTTATDLANYNAWLRENAAQQERERNAAIAHAAQVANTRASAARQYLQANIAPLQADGDAAALEIALLRDRQQELLATIPSD